MIKLNRTTEYGLMAISYIRQKSTGERASAREIADQFSLPFEILAKTLQRLKDKGIIESTQGTRGGYVLSKDLKSINLAEFLTFMEGPGGVVSCTHTVDNSEELKTCEYSSQCSIRPIMFTLNNKMNDFMRQITLEELTEPSTQRLGLTMPFIASHQGGEP